MKKKILIALAATVIAGTWVMPSFAHHRNTSGCGDRNRSYHKEEVCASYCGDGVLCGTDGHYCESHLNEDCKTDSCKGGTWSGENCENRLSHHRNGGC